MGYDMWSLGSDFFLPKENFKPACEAGQRVLRGASNDNRPVEQKLVDMFLDMRFLPLFDKDGNIEELRFEGSKHADRMRPFFNAIAQYVKKGSYLEFRGDDNTHFKWLFEGDHLEERIGRLIYE